MMTTEDDEKDEQDPGRQHAASGSPPDDNDQGDSEPEPPPSASNAGHAASAEDSPNPDPAALTLDSLVDCADDVKPTYPYGTIIQAAILGSPRQRLTLNEIYAEFQKKYGWFRTANNAWKNSVRHILSLSRLFEKVPKPITEPGKGSYWTVHIGAEGNKRERKRGKKGKKAAVTPTSEQTPGEGTMPPPPPAPNGNGNGHAYPPHREAYHEDYDYEYESPAPARYPQLPPEARVQRQYPRGPPPEPQSLRPASWGSAEPPVRRREPPMEPPSTPVVGYHYPHGQHPLPQEDLRAPWDDDYERGPPKRKSVEDPHAAYYYPEERGGKRPRYTEDAYGERPYAMEPERRRSSDERLVHPHAHQHPHYGHAPQSPHAHGHGHGPPSPQYAYRRPPEREPPARTTVKFGQPSFPFPNAVEGRPFAPRWPANGARGVDLLNAPPGASRGDRP